MQRTHTTPHESTPSLPTRVRGVLTAALVGVFLVMVPVQSWAAPTPSPSPKLAVDDVISAPVDGAFIGRNTVTVSGTGAEAGATVVVSSAGAGPCEAVVTESVDGELFWACDLTGVPNGAGRSIRATETLADDTTRTGTITVDVLGPPSIDPASPTTGIVSGTAYPGADVAVSLPDGAGSCSVAATQTGYWSCTPRVGGNSVAPASYRVTATQAHESIGSVGDRSTAVARTIEIDTVPPAPPVIVSPAGDYRLLTLPATFTGTGEAGGRVDVYLDGVPVCSARVDAGGSWACAGGSTLANAAHMVRAIQIDRAGNYSAWSPTIRVFFGPAPAAGGKNPVARPTPETPVTPTPSPVTSEEPDTASPEPTGFPTLPSLSGDAASDGLTNWGTPTTFGDGLPGLGESVDRGNWWRAVLLAIAGIALIGLPTRLLASALRGRFPPRPARFTGRNRTPAELSEEHTLGVNPWLAAALPFAITVAFMVVAGGVRGEVRYLRLAVAVGIALALLNLVGVTIAARFGHRWQGVDGRVRFTPLLLVAAIASGLFSRLIGLTPPFVSGTLIGIRMPHDTPVRGRAVVNLLQVGTVLVLGLAGWVGHSLVGEVVGFWPTLLSEIFASLCLVGIGSVLVLLLPLGALPGRVIWEWHRWVWFLVAFAGSTVAFALLLGGASAHFPLAVMLLLAGLFAAAAVAVWAILRFLARGNVPRPV